jgi:hypothetical protein
MVVVAKATAEGSDRLHVAQSWQDFGAIVVASKGYKVGCLQPNAV